jgi:hypothetical protein
MSRFRAINIGDRQDDTKFRPTRLRLDGNFTVIVTDEPPHNIQSQSGTLS